MGEEHTEQQPQGRPLQKDRERRIQSRSAGPPLPERHPPAGPAANRLAPGRGAVADPARAGSRITTRKVVRGQSSKGARAGQDPGR